MMVITDAVPITDSTMVGTISFTPKRLYTIVPISKQYRQQAAPVSEAVSSQARRAISRPRGISKAQMAWRKSLKISPTDAIFSRLGR